MTRLGRMPAWLAGPRVPAPLYLAMAVALALAVRAPGLVFTDLNWDEGLYRMIAGSLLHGHAPYLEVWDRKPVGVFVLLAAAEAVGGESVATMRIATALAVGTGAWCLAGVAHRLWGEAGRGIGAVAGVLAILYSTRSGGEGTNTELFFAPVETAGLWLLLAADAAPWAAGGPRPWRALGAGLLLGAALQVKYNAVFDIVAFGLAFLAARQRGLDLPSLRRVLAVAFPATLGIAVPTLAVLAWYAGIGHLGDWIAANIAANEQLVGATAPAFQWTALDYVLRQLALPFCGFAAALLLGPLLARPRERRGLAALALWGVGGAAALLFLRRFADHMMLQVLPELCLGTAFAAVAVARRLARLPPLRRLGRAAAFGLLMAMAACVLAWEGRAPLRPASAAREILARRMEGAPHWGDLTATLAAAIAPRLPPEESVYVFGGPLLGLYAAVGRPPPTRFPFVEHLWEGYAPVDGAAEMARILAARPAFVVVQDLWWPEADWGDPWPVPTARPVFERLQAALLADYVRDGATAPFRSRGGALIGAREGVTVFRRRDLPRAATRPEPGYVPAEDAPSTAEASGGTLR